MRGKFLICNDGALLLSINSLGATSHVMKNIQRVIRESSLEMAKLKNSIYIFFH